MSSFNPLSFTLAYQITISFIAFLLVKVCVLMTCHLHPILCTWDALPSAPVDSCHHFVSTWGVVRLEKKSVMQDQKWWMEHATMFPIADHWVWVPILAIWGRLLYLYCDVSKFVRHKSLHTCHQTRLSDLPHYLLLHWSACMWKFH